MLQPSSLDLRIIVMFCTRLLVNEPASTSYWPGSMPLFKNVSAMYPLDGPNVMSSVSLICESLVIHLILGWTPLLRCVSVQVQ